MKLKKKRLTQTEVRFALANYFFPDNHKLYLPNPFTSADDSKSLRDKIGESGYLRLEFFRTPESYYLVCFQANDSEELIEATNEDEFTAVVLCALLIAGIKAEIVESKRRKIL